MLYTTACKKSIGLDQAARRHLEAHPGIMRILPEVCRRIWLPINESELRTEVEFPYPVGVTGRVPTRLITIDTRSMFAWRIGRKHPSRVVIADPPTVNTVVVIAVPTRHAYIYRLMTAYFGTLAPFEPFDKKLSDDERDASMRFWCSNALVHDKAVMGKPFYSTWRNILRPSPLLTR
jgi:hypothetical protein